MEFFPLGIIIISVFMISLLRGLRAAFYVACAILPLGALAVVTLGNFNLLAMHTASLYYFSRACFCSPPHPAQQTFNTQTGVIRFTFKCSHNLCDYHVTNTATYFCR